MILFLIDIMPFESTEQDRSSIFPKGILSHSKVALYLPRALLLILVLSLAVRMSFGETSAR